MVGSSRSVAILIENGVEDVEFLIPYNALRKAGAKVTVLGSQLNTKYTGKHGQVSMEADATTTEALPEDFDAVVIPGGMAPDRMRTNMNTVNFVRRACEQGKLVAAICHGPQVLIEGDLLRGRRATGFRAIRKDMENAGAHYEDRPLVVDGNLITSRRPGDLPIFAAAILRRLGLTVGGYELPDENNMRAEWWKLGEEWGGSSKSEIVEAINTAIKGERYATEAFEKYAEKVSDTELKETFARIASDKRRHVERLERRMTELGERESLQAAGSSAWATLKSWFQSSDDLAVLRRALGDLQTGVNDAWNLSLKLTDPVTVELLDDIAAETAKHEQIVADLLHARTSKSRLEERKSKPTTGTATSGA